MGQKRPCKRWTRLVEARNARELTQSQVAEAIHDNQSHYCDYEAGKRIPRVDKLQRIAVALDVSADFLLDLEGPVQGAVDGIPLSTAEAALVRAYRRSREEAQAAFDGLVAATRKGA